MRVAVKNVAEYFPTAIISGRSREKVVGEFYNTKQFSSSSMFSCLLTPAYTNANNKLPCPYSVLISTFVTPYFLRYMNLLD